MYFPEAPLPVDNAEIETESDQRKAVTRKVQLVQSKNMQISCSTFLRLKNGACKQPRYGFCKNCGSSAMLATIT